RRRAQAGRRPDRGRGILGRERARRGEAPLGIRPRHAAPLPAAQRRREPEPVRAPLGRGVEPDRPARRGAPQGGRALGRTRPVGPLVLARDAAEAVALRRAPSRAAGAAHGRAVHRSRRRRRPVGARDPPRRRRGWGLRAVHEPHTGGRRRPRGPRRRPRRRTRRRGADGTPTRGGRRRARAARAADAHRVSVAATQRYSALCLIEARATAREIVPFRPLRWALAAIVLLLVLASVAGAFALPVRADRVDRAGQVLFGALSALFVVSAGLGLRACASVLR